MEAPPAPFATAVERVYARYVSGPPLEEIRAVCLEAGRAMVRKGSRVTVGWIAWQLAVARGVSMADASHAGALLDALQPVIDLADNLADEALDEATGVGLASRYPGVPRETLHGLAPLMLGCVVAALHDGFAAPRHDPSYAARRLLDTLALMTHGQGLSLDAPERVDHISGKQGTLLCLPLWLMPSAVREGADTAAIERWAFAYGRLWQLRQDARESANAAATARYRSAVDALRAAWPGGAPFVPGGALSATALLGEALP
jgi:hypothetical protein